LGWLDSETVLTKTLAGTELKCCLNGTVSTLSASQPVGQNLGAVDGRYTLIRTKNGSYFLCSDDRGVSCRPIAEPRGDHSLSFVHKNQGVVEFVERPAGQSSFPRRAIYDPATQNWTYGALFLPLEEPVKFGTVFDGEGGSLVGLRREEDGMVLVLD